MQSVKGKITVGLGCIDDYIPFVKAGADEFFIGYVPDYFLKEYKMLPALNRREVMYASVQVGARSELQILAKMMAVYHVPVVITLNSLYYHPDQYPLIKRMILECLEDGFDSFIIADMALLVYLKKEQLFKRIKIHISGEFAEINHYAKALLNEFDINRLIFHRKVSLENMRKMVDDKIEYEAFLLNEKCHFHGAFCQSVHCDLLKHSCLLDYKMNKPVKEVDLPFVEDYFLGQSGCGLCALWRMKEMGITHYKLVSRGNYSEDTYQDISNIKKALQLCEESLSEEEYIVKMKQALFKEGCSNNCYYSLSE